MAAVNMEPYQLGLNFEPECSSFFNASLEDEGDLQEWYYTTGETIVIAVALSIISVGGILGNSALIAVIVFVPDMHTIMNMYLSVLASVDLLYCLCTLCDHLWTYFSSDGIAFAQPYRSDIGCAITESLVHLTLFMSMGIIPLVSLERFLAVCCPLRHRYMASKNRTIKLLILVGIIAAMLTGIVVPSYSKLLKICVIWPATDDFSDLPTTFYQCGPVKSDFVIVHRVGENVFFVLILLTSTIWYSKVIAHLSRRVSSEDVNGHQTHSLKTRNHVALMVIVNGLVFFCCLFPYQFFNFYIYMGFSWLTQRQSYTFLWVARLFGALNSALNPIIYTAINPNYRGAFVEMFCRSKRRSKIRTSEWASKSLNTATELPGPPDTAV